MIITSHLIQRGLLGNQGILGGEEGSRQLIRQCVDGAGGRDIIKEVASSLCLCVASENASAVPKMKTVYMENF